jgi:CHASE3 domain sensor protein
MYQREAEKFKHDNDLTNLKKEAENDPMAAMRLKELENGVDYMRYEIITEANRSSKREGKVGLDEMRKEINKITDRKEKRERQRAYDEEMKGVVDLLDDVESFKGLMRYSSRMIKETSEAQ